MEVRNCSKILLALLFINTSAGRSSADCIWYLCLFWSVWGMFGKHSVFVPVWVICGQTGSIFGILRSFFWNSKSSEVTVNSEEVVTFVRRSEVMFVSVWTQIIHLFAVPAVWWLTDNSCGVPASFAPREGGWSDQSSITVSQAADCRLKVVQGWRRVWAADG